MEEKSFDFNLSSLRDKITKLDNMAAAAGKFPSRVWNPVTASYQVSSDSDGVGLKRTSQEGQPDKQVNNDSEADLSSPLKNDGLKPSADIANDSIGAENSETGPKVTRHEERVGSKNSETHSYVNALKTGANQKKVNFRSLSATSSVEGVDLLIPLESVLQVNSRFSNSLYGYFLGDRLAYPVVENYVRNTWAKFGLRKVMMNNAGFFFFQFDTRQGMEQVLEKGPWMIRSMPIFLKEWTPNVNLNKQDLSTVPVWVKMYDVPLPAYTEDGLSMLATKLGKPLSLDSYTSQMCLNSWGRHSFARALIELDASHVLKDELIIGIPNLNGEGFSKEVVRIEYEWKPPHCATCKVFGHDIGVCPRKPLVSQQANVQVVEDGFTEVTRRRGKGKDRQVEGIRLTKPKPQFVYKPKQPSEGSKQPGSQTSVQHKAAATSSKTVGENQRVNTGKAGTSGNASVNTKNAFSILGDGVDEFGFDIGSSSQGRQDDCNLRNSTVNHDVPDNDDDEVEEVFNECPP